MPRPRDPWADVLTLHGLAADEIVSTLQKSIRRGLVENAVLAARELVLTSPELEAFMWARLAVIAVEDVGFGDIDMPLRIDTLSRNHAQCAPGSGDRFLFAVHAIRLLCRAQKDRTSDEMAGWARRALDRGTLPEIPDFALDMHTRRGQQMGRDGVHFLEEASRVTNEIEDRDTTYRDRLLALKRS
jgi:replication-associated recombination protein RarA